MKNLVRPIVIAALISGSAQTSFAAGWICSALCVSHVYSRQESGVSGILYERSTIKPALGAGATKQAALKAISETCKREEMKSRELDVDKTTKVAGAVQIQGIDDAASVALEDADVSCTRLP